MTTLDPTADQGLRHRIREMRASARQVYRPLTEGWSDTKAAYGARAERRRARFASASPLMKFLVIAIPLLVIYALPMLPFISPFYRTVLVDRVAFYVLLTLGLNVVVGFAGLLDLGYVAFYAIGAYTAAYFTGKMPVKPPAGLTFDTGLEIFLIFPIAILVTMLCGVLLGLPTLRLRGDYLAIVTLGFHEIVRITLNNSDSITRGARGIPAIPHFQLGSAVDPAVVNYGVIILVMGLLIAAIGAVLYLRAGPRRNQVRGLSIALVAIGALVSVVAFPIAPRLIDFFGRFVDFGLDPIPYYYLAVTICILMVLLVNALSNSRVGRAWVAIREDEIAAEAMGVPTLKLKVWAFAIGASTAGFAGVMLAIKTSFINPQNFILLQSIIVLAMVVFGGMGSISGAIAGAIFIGFTQEALRDFDVVPFGPLIAVIGIIMAIVGLLIVVNVIRTRVGRPYGFWLLGIGIVLAVAAPVLRIPFVRIAEEPESWRLFILGLILVVVMVVRPEGLIPSRRRAMELHGEATAVEEEMAVHQDPDERETPAARMGGEH